jgi:hypothetical protein
MMEDWKTQPRKKKGFSSARRIRPDLMLKVRGVSNKTRKCQQLLSLTKKMAFPISLQKKNISRSQME